MGEDKPSPEQPIYQANLPISLTMHENERRMRREGKTMKETGEQSEDNLPVGIARRVLLKISWDALGVLVLKYWF